MYTVLFSGLYQALGGDQGPVSANFVGNSLGTGNHLGSECLFECAGQRVDGWCGGRVRIPDAELLDSTHPVLLVVMPRDDDLGRTASRGGMCGPCAAVVNKNGNPFEQRLVIDLTNGHAMASGDEFLKSDRYLTDSLVSLQPFRPVNQAN